MKKKKTYVLMISEVFPKNHKKSGSPTNFIPKINSLLKIHTIRGNYELWKKRFEKIASGEAALSIRVWEGKPYNSKQIPVFNFNSVDGIGIEKLEFHEDKDGVNSIKFPLIENYAEPKIETIAENDGLSYTDFKDWFKDVDYSKPLAIIHFTHFRYKTLNSN